MGHGVMDLRYHEGGRECGQPCTVTGTVNAKMQMFAMDVVVPAGKRTRTSHKRKQMMITYPHL
ncbi:MAG: hypothetical protein ACJZ2J_01835 [Candidatus Poseidoniales archaeon]